MKAANNNRMEMLAYKWLHHSCTPEEEQELYRWYAKDLDSTIHIPADFVGSDEELRHRIYLAIQEQVAQRPSYSWFGWVAAIAVFLLGVGFFTLRQKTAPTAEALTASEDILPGGDHATLTLADGSRILLSEAQNGKLAEQSGVEISKTAEGQLIYSVSADTHLGASNTMAYNTIETPRGGQYQVILPDGTKVWLNAASSFKYPLSFAKAGPRKVLLQDGEAYFEVAPDQRRPFIVETDRQQVEVLGTHFNISTYAEENLTRTTLMEGRVKVTDLSSRDVVTLRPGQQSVVTASPGIRINYLNVDDIVLWKDGKFSFDNEPIESIMQKVARWYKVDIVYEAPVQQVRITGSVSRFEKLSKLLEKLEQTGLVGFKREGNTLTVMKP